MHFVGVRSLIFLLACCAFARAQEPIRQDLFVAGTHGYGMYRIPGLVVTASGALLAYAEARKSPQGTDWDPIDLVIRRSEDGGKTWSAQQVIGQIRGPLEQNPATAGTGRRPGFTYNNPVAIADRKKGVVHFLYCFEYMRAFYMRSEDDGRTFSAPREITSTFEALRAEYAWKVIATGPGHGIQLRSGRLLVPVWLSNAEDNPHHPNWLATIYSDDGGGTWKAGAIALRSGGEVVNPNETVAVELANGQVMLNVRSMSARHRRIVITSPDGAGRWSAARFQEELLEPICFGSLVRYGKTSARGPNRLLFVNPDTLERRDGKAVAGQSRDRRNLTVQLSEDDGQSWKRKRVLEAGWSAYADIAVGRDNVIHVLYERGAPDPSRMRTAALTLASFPLRWLLTKDNSQE